MNLSQNPWQVTPEPKKVHKETQDGVQKKLDFTDVAGDEGCMVYPKYVQDVL